MKIKKISFLLNLLIVLSVIFGLFCMISGFKFMRVEDIFSESGLEALKYFTVDSNILAGLASAFLIIFMLFQKSGQLGSVPRSVFVFKYISTVSVTLTFLVTLVFLAPTSGYDFWWFYSNSNLFFHFIVPVLSFISFCFFEKGDIRKFDILFALIPMVIYGVFYFFNVISHIQNRNVSMAYDFYGFVKGGV